MPAAARAAALAALCPPYKPRSCAACLAAKPALAVSATPRRAAAENRHVKQ